MCEAIIDLAVQSMLYVLKGRLRNTVTSDDTVFSVYIVSSDVYKKKILLSLNYVLLFHSCDTWTL